MWFIKGKEVVGWDERERNNIRKEKYYICVRWVYLGYICL